VSYHKELDEYTEQQLLDELERRRSLRDEGKCDYCQRLGNTTDCKFPERHAIARLHWNNIGRFQVPPKFGE
jgi:hypothetical protein